MADDWAVGVNQIQKSLFGRVADRETVGPGFCPGPGPGPTPVLVHPG